MLIIVVQGLLSRVQAEVMERAKATAPWYMTI